MEQIDQVFDHLDEVKELLLKMKMPKTSIYDQSDNLTQHYILFLQEELVSTILCCDFLP